ncbi:MAG: putative ATP-grasp superfamily ATP-dependent carboligase [Candidatus Azotimanducaceae bacterium]|jgi:predicted ATP-grasp superfamily ATP-dependent carboligase
MPLHKNDIAVIVLDGHLKSALSVVRSLGKKGITVSAGSTRNTAMSLHSKYAASTFVYPSPYTHQKEFVDAVIKAASTLDSSPVVYVLSDATYLTLFQYRDVLKEHLRLVFPEATSVEIAFDKAATHSQAKVLGVPVVPTYLPATEEEVARLSGEMEYPVVVKNRQSVTWKDGVGIFGSAEFIHTKEQLRTCFVKLTEETGTTPIVQPFIEGEEYGVELLLKEGSILAQTVHHRIRSLSPSGGASVLKETLPIEGSALVMYERACTLARALSWSGPMMVEFKVERDSREPLLMEINGRWWGSLPLAIKAGVDFPYLQYQMSCGVDMSESVVSAKPEIVTRHFLGDVRHLLRVWFSHDKMRELLYPARTKALRDFLRVPMRTAGDVLSWSDLKPSIMEYIDILKNLWTTKA